MEGRPPHLHLRSLAFQVHEGILHYDSPLDWNRGYSPCPQLGVVVSGDRIVCSAGCDNWPSRFVYYLRASVTNQIPPLLRTLPNYCLVVYVQSLLSLPWSNAVCSNCLWTSLLLSPIVVAAAPRLSTPPLNGIGSTVDAIPYIMSWR